MKRIGIMTSGGDCPGLNAVIRAATYHGIHHYGYDMIGIRRGAEGLITREFIPLSLGHVNHDLLVKGGSMLGSLNKGDPYKYRGQYGQVMNFSEEVIKGVQDLGIHAMIVVGGDGSLNIMNRLSQEGKFPIVAVPKTIDNDLGGTERAVGFLSSVDLATEAIDRLHSTAESHERVLVIEVMGRDAGHIALHAGIAGGADVILIPEINYTLNNIIQKVQETMTKGRGYGIIVVAEGTPMESGEVSMVVDGGSKRPRYARIGEYIAGKIAEMTPFETRTVVLGHLQRGGSPTPEDRILASAFGVYAVDLVAREKYGRMVALQNQRIVDIPIVEAIAGYSVVDPQGPLVYTARGVGISFGD